MLTTALHYSGGKDSRVILDMYRDQLDSILVVWANAGAPYPEVKADIRKTGDSLPHFLEVKGDQPGNIQLNGYPTDVLPLRFSPLGRQVSPGNRKLQSTFACCNDNLWRPMHEAMHRLGITTIIRGQRDTDEYRNPAFRDGAVVDGVTCVAPLQDWTESQVWDYLRSHKINVPAYYRREQTGRDCWNCTGYLSHNVARINNLRPDMKTEVIGRLHKIDEAIRAETAPLTQILELA